MMIIIAVVAVVLLLLHLFLLLLGSIRKDSNIKNCIMMHGGRSVGSDTATPGILYKPHDDMETVLAGNRVPGASVTSAFVMLYIRLVDIETETVYEGYLDKQLEIGRIGSQANIQLYDDKVSYKHCMISRRGEQILIQDLGSTNHTWVNNCILEAPMPLAFGDLVTIGSHTYRFQFFDV